MSTYENTDEYEEVEARHVTWSVADKRYEHTDGRLVDWTPQAGWVAKKHPHRPHPNDAIETLKAGLRAIIGIKATCYDTETMRRIARSTLNSVE